MDNLPEYYQIFATAVAFGLLYHFRKTKGIARQLFILPVAIGLVGGLAIRASNGVLSIPAIFVLALTLGLTSWVVFNTARYIVKLEAHNA